MVEAGETGIRRRKITIHLSNLRHRKNIMVMVAEEECLQGVEEEEHLQRRGHRQQMGQEDMVAPLDREEDLQMVALVEAADLHLWIERLPRTQDSDHNGGL